MKKKVKLRKEKLVAFVFLFVFFLSEKKREKIYKEAIPTTTTRSVIRFWNVDCSIGFFPSS